MFRMLNLICKRYNNKPNSRENSEVNAETARMNIGAITSQITRKLDEIRMDIILQIEAAMKSED